MGGAILLSIYAGLFWVGVLMLTHFFLEFLHHTLEDYDMPAGHALWEVKLDIGLFLFALVIVLYSDAVLAALGLGHAARAAQAVKGAQMVTRLGIVERSLRILLLTIDDIAKFFLALWRGLSGNKKVVSVEAVPAKPLKQEESEHLPSCEPYPWKNVQKGDMFSLGFGLVCLFLIIASPFLMGTGYDVTFQTLASELHP
jgi:hypothetical protein